MFTNKPVLALVTMFFLLAPAPAQNGLQWKFEKGQVYDVERSASQKQTVAIKGKEFKQDRHSTWHVRLEVKDRQGDAFAVAATLTKVEHQLAGGAATELLDPQLAEKMQGAVFTLIVTPSGRIVEFKGYEEFLAKLAGKDQARMKSLRIQFPAATLKDAFADLFGPLPDKEVGRGDAWQRTYVEPIPHFGALQATVRYVLEGDAKGNAQISYAIRTKYEKPKDDMMVLFRIVKGSIDSEKAKGTIVFDRAAGHLVEHERSMLLRGTLTIETMDRQQPLEFTSANELKIRVTKK